MLVVIGTSSVHLINGFIKCISFFFSDTSSLLDLFHQFDNFILYGGSFTTKILLEFKIHIGILLEVLTHLRGRFCVSIIFIMFHFMLLFFSFLFNLAFLFILWTFISIFTCVKLLFFCTFFVIFTLLLLWCLNWLWYFIQWLWCISTI